MNLPLLLPSGLDIFCFVGPLSPSRAHRESCNADADRWTELAILDVSHGRCLNLSSVVGDASVYALIALRTLQPAWASASTRLQYESGSFFLIDVDVGQS
jgi:hypothetical protein